MLDLWHTLTEELADLPDGPQVVRVAVRLLLAALLGGVLGFERERHGKPAGIRTLMLISLGAALFALVPQQMGMSNDAVARVLQGLVAGIGFLGAGPILKLEEKMDVKGLTTAASVWMSTVIGMTAGLGRGLTAILATGLTLVVLALLPKGDHLSQKIEPNGQSRSRV